jgi:hypothetical protein
MITPSRRAAQWLAAFACLVIARPSLWAGEPTAGRDPGRPVTWLAINDAAFPLRRGLCYYLSRPSARREPVLVPSRDNPHAPDYMAAHFYGSVVFDQGRFRMWYYAVNAGRDLSDLKQGPVCYAESQDGLRWTKPILGEVEFHGSRSNNAVRLPDRITQGVAVILDPQDPDPQRRYKMVYNAHNGQTWVFRAGTSPDGTAWTFAPDYGISQFIELSSFYRHQGLYVVNGQSVGDGEGGAARGRQGYAFVSTDFVHWLPEAADAFSLPEPAEPSERGFQKPYDQVHLGVGGASVGEAVVGLYGRWHNFAGDTRRAIPNSWFGFGQISCDFGLVISNDGLHFREPVKDHIYLARTNSPVSPIEGKPYPTILCQSGNGILNVGDETRIYHGRWRNSEYGLDYWGEVALATLPRDRWGALGLPPGGADGWVWSKPVVLPAPTWHIRLNAEAAAAIGVEVADAQFRLLPGLSGPHAGRGRDSGGLEAAVDWPDADPRPLAGRTVRFRFHLAGSAPVRPRLFAVYLDATDGAGPRQR